MVACPVVCGRLVVVEDTCVFFKALVRLGNRWWWCDVVILVKANGPKLSRISESIMRAICWNPPPLPFALPFD